MGRKKCQPTSSTPKTHWLGVLKKQEHPQIKALAELEDNETKLPDWSSQEEQKQFWSEVDSNFKYHLNNIFPPENEEGENSSDGQNDEVESRKELQDNAQQFVSATAHSIRQDIIEHEHPTVSHPMAHLVTVMQGLLGNTDIKPQVKIHITDMFHVWCQKKLFMNESVSLCSLLYLLKRSLEPCALKADVHRVWQFREALKVSFASGEMNPNIMKLLLELPQKSIYLESKEGPSFIALTMSIDEHVTEGIHDVIKKALETCKVPQAQAYGAIYCQAWQMAQQSVREVIERKFQNYMHHFFMLQRKGLAMSVLGANLFNIARCFHAQRKNLAMKKMLSGIYSTLLWMFLEDGSNNNRLNAAQVLFDAYPMDKPGAGREENTLFLGEQHRAITNLLTDRFHMIRILAVRQVCGIMAEYWLVIPQDMLKSWIEIMVKKLANDGSDVEVRRSVYRSIPKLFSNPHARDYLIIPLKSLKENIHDVNQNVRLAYVEMLIAIKESGVAKFWEIVPMEHIVLRLEHENRFVGSKLVDLLYDSFLQERFDSDSICRRFAQIIIMNRNAARKFFLFSECRLSAKRAIEIMLLLVAKMYTYVKTTLEEKRKSGNVALSELQENDPKQKSKRQKKKLYVGKENVSLDTSDKEDSSEETIAAPGEDEEKDTDIYLRLDPSNPLVSQGFIDIVGTLWTLHTHTYLKDKYATDLKNLHTLCAAAIPLFLRYYKQDSAIFGSVLYLCSLVPLSVLKAVSTVEGMLLSQMKKLSLSDTQDSITMRVHPLCMWGHSTDILELAQDWLNEAFRVENLNATVTDRATRRRRKVNFEKTQEAKPRLGLRLLASMLDQPLIKTKVLEKNYDQLLEFWLFSSKIKTLVDNRMSGGCPFEHPLLSEEFLEECFKQYILLIPTLDVKDSARENKLDALLEFKFIFQWSTEILLDAVPAEPPSDPHRSSNVGVSPFTRLPLPILMVKDVLEVASNMVAIGLVDERFTCEAGKFCLRVLETGCKMMFVHSITRYLIVSMSYIKYHHKEDKMNLFRSVTITVVMKILDTLGEMRYDLNTTQRLLENFTQVKGFLASVIAACKLYGKSSSKFVHRLARSFAVNIVNILKHEIAMVQVVDCMKKVQDLPYLACHMTLLVQANEAFAEVFLEELKNYFSEDFRKKPLLLISGFSLLHLLACCRGKFKKPSLISVLEAAQKAFSDYEEYVKELNLTAEVDVSANTTSKLDLMEELKTLKKATRLELLGNNALELWEVDELVRQQLQEGEEERELEEEASKS